MANYEVMEVSGESCDSPWPTRNEKIFIRLMDEEVKLKKSRQSCVSQDILPQGQINVEVSSDLPPKPIPSPVQQQSEEESTQKLPPNKLVENIMTCLIFIFMRLLRTSRAMELEKSGAISRSANFPLSSRSFRVDTSSNNSKASSLIQRESKQQDPYGIFDSQKNRFQGTLDPIRTWLCSQLATRFYSTNFSLSHHHNELG